MSHKTLPLQLALAALALLPVAASAAADPFVPPPPPPPLVAAGASLPALSHATGGPGFGPHSGSALAAPSADVSLVGTQGTTAVLRVRAGSGTTLRRCSHGSAIIVGGLELTCQVRPGEVLLMLGKQPMYALGLESIQASAAPSSSASSTPASTTAPGAAR